MLYKSSRTPDPHVKVNHYIVLVLLLASLPYHIVEESVVEGRRDGAGLRCLFFFGGGSFFFPCYLVRSDEQYCFSSTVRTLKFTKFSS